MQTRCVYIFDKTDNSDEPVNDDFNRFLQPDVNIDDNNNDGSPPPPELVEYYPFEHDLPDLPHEPDNDNDSNDAGNNSDSDDVGNNQNDHIPNNRVPSNNNDPNPENDLRELCFG